jgi:hypothetical protein
MKKIARGFILPSSAITIKRKEIVNFTYDTKAPECGDLVYGEVTRIGHHSSIEHTSGRLHRIQDGTKSVFVFGNRYSPAQFEGEVPDKMLEEVDMLSQSGVVGIVKTKNALIKDPTRIKVLGYVYDKSGHVLNTKDHYLINPFNKNKKEPRAPMILICGTSMNSGKSMAASACCWALSTLGYNVRGAKITGTASLKDILHMNDAGAGHYADFSYLGFPSTYKLSLEELLFIFNSIDLKYANNPNNYWVVELADGVIQRETAMLLSSPEIQSRIHKLIFCASDAFGAIGGLRVMKEQFNLIPDAISGICSSSPLFIKELSDYSQIPVFSSVDINVDLIQSILLSPKLKIA